MAYNPFSLFAPAAMFLCVIPLMVSAVFTTTIAVFVLSIRASTVYLELAFNVIRALLFPGKSANVKLPMPTIATSPEEVRLRRRRSSMFNQSQLSSGDSGNGIGVSNGASENGGRKKALQKTDSFNSLVGSGTLNRDYEGVGGWRDFAGEDDDAVWLNINSRLHMPSARQNGRHHQRSLTGGSGRFSHSPELIRMSPVQSRARTPSVHSLLDNGSGMVSPEEYFGLQPHRHSMVVEQTPVPAQVGGFGPITTASGQRKSFSEERVNDTVSSGRSRRKSTGADSSSSSSSARSSRLTTKQTSVA